MNFINNFGLADANGENKEAVYVTFTYEREGQKVLLKVPILTIVPIPYAVSSSVASSIAALAFSVPLTIMTFGSYTIGSLFTTLPATIMITVYMGISLAALLFPFLSPVLDFFFDIISAFFSFAASFPQADDLVPYIAVLTSGIVFYAIGSLRKRRIAKNAILKVC